MTRWRKRNTAVRTRSPWDREVVCVRLRVLQIAGPAFAIVFFAGLLALLVITWWSERPHPEVSIELLVVVLIVLTALSIGLIVRLYHRDRLRRLLAQKNPREGSVRVQRRRTVEALLNLRRLERPIGFLRAREWSHLRIVRSLDRYQLPGSCTIVGSKVRPYLREIARTSELLEPELVAGRMESRELKKLLILAGVTIVLSLALRFGPPWAGALLMICLLVCSIQVTYFLYLWLSGSVRRTRTLIVGPGALASSKQLWTRDQAVTIVLLGGSVLHLDIVSAQGKLALRFTAGGEHFKEFWQRWMHPHPRPDIVREAAR